MKILDYPRSGSYQGVTSSHNSFGQYVRNRSIPVNPGSSFQAAVRARLATNAGNWRLLTAAQQAGWASLGASMTRTDSLGQTYTLTGFDAYVSVNNNNLAAGNAVVSDAPILTAPDALTTLTPTITAASFSVAYTPTPMGAGERVFIFASPQRSAGRNFEGDARLILVTAAAAASPANLLAAYSARFGAPVTGNKIFVGAQRYSLGFLSTALFTSAIVS